MTTVRPCESAGLGAEFWARNLGLLGFFGAWIFGLGGGVGFLAMCPFMSGLGESGGFCWTWGLKTSGCCLDLYLTGYERFTFEQIYNRTGEDPLAIYLGAKLC